LADLAVEFGQEIAAAYEKKDREALAKGCVRYLELIRDLDGLLATRKEFLLGRWLADARRWGASDEEQRLCEWNARTIITLWGSRDSDLHEYANKQWSGLLTSFYLPRWQMFFDRLDSALAAGKPFDANAWEQVTREWEEQWTRRTDEYPTDPRGDSVAAVRRLWTKYEPYFGERGGRDGPPIQ
jgi:alpha-N-acetylglucosaminidase